MELKDFCEICSGKAGDDRECRICATTWLGKGAPPKYQVDSLYLNSVLNKTREKLSTKTASSGSHAHYYQLPSGATELQDIISANNMNSQMGEIGRAWLRYGRCKHSSRVRDLNKIIFYAEAELNRIAKYEENNQ